MKEAMAYSYDRAKQAEWAPNWKGQDRKVVLDIREALNDEYKALRDRLVPKVKKSLDEMLRGLEMDCDRDTKKLAEEIVHAAMPVNAPEEMLSTFALIAYFKNNLINATLKAPK